RIPADQPVAFAGAERIVLSRAARQMSGDLYVPLDFVTKVVEPLLRAPKPPSLPVASRTSAPPVKSATPAPMGMLAAGSGVAPPVVTVASRTAARRVPPTPPSPGPAGAPPAAPGSTPESPLPSTAPPPVAAPPAKPTTAAFTVVLDPGHGGVETGAEGKKGAGGKPGMFEKD